MEFEIEQEKLNKIKECIKSNEDFNDSKDFFDKVLNETIKRGFIIFKTMDFNTPSANVYINKIIASSIEYISDMQNNTDNINQSTDETKTEHKNYDNKYGKVQIKFDFDYTPAISGIKIKSDIIQNFYDNVIIINSQYPEKEYLQIFNLRYAQKLSINQISKKLNIKEEIISKNLYELMEKVEETLI